MSDVQWKEVGTPNYWGRTFSVPVDAKPDWPNPLPEICVKDKYERGKGCNPKEARDFFGICEYGADQLVACYGTMKLEEWWTPRDFMSACSRCPYCKSKIRHQGIDVDPFTWYDPFGKQESIFHAGTIYNKCIDLLEFEEPKSFVYFISDGEYVKIGKGTNPTERLRELQTGNGRKLELISLIPCKDESSAYKVETALHDIYKLYRLCGEWFDILKKIKMKTFNSVFPVDFKDSLQEAI